MSPFASLTVAAAAALVIGTAAPAIADSQLAQGKPDKVMSGEKGADKAHDAMDRKGERATGRDNAMERGEGRKKGLMKQTDGDAGKRAGGKKAQ